MSEEIKTQHGTIGLLMAECEQLRRDLAQAKENSKTLATEVTRLLHETNALQTELAQAKAEIERLRQQISSEKVKP